MSTSCIHNVLHYLPMAIWAEANIEEAETLGELLSQKRKDLLGTPGQVEQYDIAKSIGYSQSYVSKIENGQAEHIILKWNASRQLALLLAYQFTEIEISRIAEKFGLELPSSFFASYPSDLPEPQEIGGFVRLEVIQAQGGTLDLDDDGKVKRRGARFQDVPEVFLNGSRPKDTKIVEVLGSSMCCEDIRLTIPEGSFVLVNTVDEPQPGDIIVCDLRIVDKWFRILKIFDRVGHIILRSYNDEHAPIILQGDMELIKVGVYVNHTGPGRLAMRRLNRKRGLAKV